MMSREFLKKLGVMGVTLGLTASPFALAQQTQQDGFQTTPGQATDHADPAVPQTQQQDGFGQQDSFGQDDGFSQDSFDQGQDGFGQGQDSFDQGQDSFGQDTQPDWQDSEPGFGDGPQSLPGESASDPYAPGEGEATDPYGTESDANTGTGTVQ